MKVAQVVGIVVVLVVGGGALFTGVLKVLEDANKALKSIGPKPCLHPIGENNEHDEHELCGVGA